MSKEVKKQQKTTPRTKQDNALLITFVILVILVIVLTIIAINMKNAKEKEKANIIIPVLEKNAESEIGVDISQMKKGESKEYIFKVSNYKDKDINEEVLTYDIDVTPSEKAKIKLYKNGSNKNLIDEDDLLIEENKLPKKDKTEDEYHMIIEVTSQPDSQDKITLKIQS